MPDISTDLPDCNCLLERDRNDYSVRRSKMGPEITRSPSPTWLAQFVRITDNCPNRLFGMFFGQGDGCSFDQELDIPHPSFL